jgi:hypothetical protein
MRGSAAWHVASPHGNHRNGRSPRGSMGIYLVYNGGLLDVWAETHLKGGEQSEIEGEPQGTNLLRKSRAGEGATQKWRCYGLCKPRACQGAGGYSQLQQWPHVPLEPRTMPGRLEVWVCSSAVRDGERGKSLQVGCLGKARTEAGLCSNKHHREEGKCSPGLGGSLHPGHEERVHHPARRAHRRHSRRD